MLPKSVQNLIKEFAKLPGVGMKTAARLTFFLLSKPDDHVRRFGQAIIDLKNNLDYCQDCFNITDQEKCKICLNSQRDQGSICVVATPLDVVAIEKGGQYNGLYHVLGGVISPVDGVGPDNLRIKDLLDRIKNDTTIKEVILATNPDLEGFESVFEYTMRLPHLQGQDS
jgi:recombination protein RecR